MGSKYVSAVGVIVYDSSEHAVSNAYVTVADLEVLPFFVIARACVSHLFIITSTIHLLSAWYRTCSIHRRAMARALVVVVLLVLVLACATPVHAGEERLQREAERMTRERERNLAEQQRHAEDGRRISERLREFREGRRMRHEWRRQRSEEMRRRREAGELPKQEPIVRTGYEFAKLRINVNVGLRVLFTRLYCPLLKRFATVSDLKTCVGGQYCFGEDNKRTCFPHSNSIILDTQARRND